MKVNFITKFFWTCSGASSLILKKCPSESNKYVGIGATVLFTGIFAAVSGAYALFTVFDSAWAPVLFGLLWGSMIFNLDRYIVSSMKKEGKAWAELKLAMPRLIMAIMLAIVISKPLELRIFQREIDEELVFMSQAMFKDQEDRVKSRFQTKIDILNMEIDKMNGQMDAKAKVRDALALEARQEADGSGGSGHRSMGPIYKAKKQDADNAGEELTRLTARLQPIIEKKQKMLIDTEKELHKSVKDLRHEGYDGLAARIGALESASAKSFPVAVANWFIFFLFIAIETAPLFVKLLSARGPYDDMLKAHEHAFSIYRMERIARLNRRTSKRLKMMDSQVTGAKDDAVVKIRPKAGA